MIAFTTVGSTKFDTLVQAVLSQPVLSALRLQGYSTLVIQSGNSEVDVGTSAKDTTVLQKHGVDIEIWKFKPSLAEDFDRADLIISHAGALRLSVFVNVLSCFDRLWDNNRHT